MMTATELLERQREVERLEAEQRNRWNEYLKAQTAVAKAAELHSNARWDAEEARRELREIETTLGGSK